MRNCGKDTGREVLAHAPGSDTYSAYDFGIGDLDMAVARLSSQAITAEERNIVQRSNAPAITNIVADATNQREGYIEYEIRKGPEY